MVGGDHKKVVLPKERQKLSQLLVEPLQLLSIANRISPMAPEGVKIHQIHKAQAGKIFFTELNGLLHAVDRRLGFMAFCDPLSVKDIPDLSYGDYIIAVILQDI